MNNSQKNYLRWILSIIGGVLVLIGSFYLSRVKIDYNRFAAIGYAGVFLATLIGSATLFFPIPNLATVFAAGALFNPIGIAIAGGFGSTFGEMSGYFVGLGGESVIKQSKWRPKILNWLQRYGGITIFLLALIPNPFFDLVGLASGIIHYPISKFFLATLCGKTLRCLVLAYLGSIVK